MNLSVVSCQLSVMLEIVIIAAQRHSTRMKEQSDEYNATDNGQRTTDQFKDYVRYETRRQFLSRGSNAVSWAALAALLRRDGLAPSAFAGDAGVTGQGKGARRRGASDSRAGCRLRRRPSR